MQIEPLSLSHQELLESKFKLLNLPISEYSFANLYLFRKLHHYFVMKLNGLVFVKGITRDGIPFIMPTSRLKQSDIEMLLSVLLPGEILYPIPEGFIRDFDKYLVEVIFKEKDSDYVFTSSKLASYPGRHLSKKRNLIKQLHSQHAVKGEPLEGRLKDAEILLKKWEEERSLDEGEGDFKECLEAIEKFHQLHLTGRIVDVDGKPAGFTIGMQLTDDCYDMQFCKGSRSTKGLYQFLYQDAAQSLGAPVKWINLEQDLGIPALRQAKHSYQPDKFLIKWQLKLK